jgi:Ca2+-binding EF-hand superfamily protein
MDSSTGKSLDMSWRTWENMEKKEIESLINEIDIDGDGQINYEEFYTMMCTK